MLYDVTYRLGPLAQVESSFASLIVSPDEVLRPDGLLTRSSNAAASMGRLSQLILALSQTLQKPGSDPSVQPLRNALLQAFAFMTRELSRLMSNVHWHAARSGCPLPVN